MIFTKKTLISTAVTLSLLAPMFSHAAGLSTTQMSAVTSLLRSFGVSSSTISTVQATLATATLDTTVVTPKSETKACVALLRNLSVGARGDDVRRLQELLNEDDDQDDDIPPTGFFGPMTEKALKKFQEKHRVAPGSTGTAGPLTRRFFEMQCGKEAKEPKGNGGETMGAAVTGTIATASGTTITVSSLQGEVRTVAVVASTTIKVFVSTSTPPTAGTFANLVVGKRVHVEGKKNSDGSITARMINVGMPNPPKSEDGRGPKGNNGNGNDR